MALDALVQDADVVVHTASPVNLPGATTEADYCTPAVQVSDWGAYVSFDRCPFLCFCSSLASCLPLMRMFQADKTRNTIVGAEQQQSGLFVVTNTVTPAKIGLLHSPLEQARLPQN